MISHPTLTLTPTTQENVVNISLEGMDEDLFFVVLAADALEDSYFPIYDLNLPLDVARSAMITMGVFPAGYGGGEVEVEVDLSGSIADQLHFVVVTFTTHGLWVPSNVASFELSQ